MKRHNEAKKYHRRRRGYFFLKLFLILIFYPIVPAVIYAGVLWVWGIRNITMEALENRQNLARQIRGEGGQIEVRLVDQTQSFSGISGGFEAGLQLSLTLWLVLKGVIPLEDILCVHWRRGSYGNYSPSIPLISAVSSLLSMVWSCVRNIANKQLTSLINNPICSGEIEKC